MLREPVVDAVQDSGRRFGGLPNMPTHPIRPMLRRDLLPSTESQGRLFEALDGKRNPEGAELRRRRVDDEGHAAIE